MNKRSFFRKYFTGLLIILFFSLLAVGVYSTWAISKFSQQDTANRQKDYALLLREMMPSEGFSSKEAAESFVQKSQAAENIRLTVIDKHGWVIGDSHTLAASLDNHNNRPEIRNARAYGSASAKRYSNSLNEIFLYTAVLQEKSDQVLRISMAVGNIQAEANHSYIRVTLVTLMILILTLVITYSQGQTISRMLNSMRLTTEDYASGDFSKALYLSGFKEAYELSRSVNLMGKQLQERLNQIFSEKEKSQAMLNHLNEPVLSLDSSLRILEANRAALEMGRKSMEQCRGKNLVEIFRNLELCEIADKAKLTGRTQHSLIFWKEEGKYLQIHVGIVKKEDKSTLLLVMNDVTEIKKLELMRKDFVGNVSHELRTPVTSIMGFADTLLISKEIPWKKQKEFIKIIRKQSRRLSAIIDDLLSLSAIEEEESLLPKKELSANKLIKGALRICQHKADEKNILLKIELCEQDIFKSHRNLTEQALVNYIDNAIKYSPEGSIVRIATEKEEKFLTFHVIDNGPGIPLDQQSRIFERFFRVDKARSREVGGTGLGLSIVKHIALRLNGKVGLKSYETKGCDFWISFPLN